MLGERIRTKRKELNMSIKEVADKTGLTSGFISQVERDLADPSITSLRRIAEALEVPIFYFLMETKEQNPVVRKHERKKLNFPSSHLTYELLTPDLNRQMEMFMARLEPGAVTCEEPLSHPGEEGIVVMQGKMKITIGNDEYVLDEGDSIYYLSSIPHKIESTGTEDLLFISSVTPPAF
ncbi:MerR family transcriptional regulator [Desulfuribacillus stibiiarsenatis]|uniref:MerR family transcriptional regulator n=1 Tax=Desulfuribacillus stibiiarsenatis TaxID=1390249 RepID=A0A1E5L2C5_9FIRM|nr:cupin domain-containing protein [Desulfuribacillus stibiiarsenatis]OEH84270.1 MerR family transcriptional regulator [Desulfuribacillus stibiiarsenatis]